MSKITAANAALPVKSIRERVFHAIVFELIGIALFAPGLAWLLDQSLGKMGAMTVIISTAAMLWNMVFNAAFDQVRGRFGFAMTLNVRILHALSFETGLTAVVVPLAAWWLSISLWEAFLLDFVLLLLFLPYTLLFNLAYDRMRERIHQRSVRAADELLSDAPQ